MDKPETDFTCPAEQLSDLDIPVKWRDLGVLIIAVPEEETN